MCKRRYMVPFTGCGRIHLSQKCNMAKRRNCALFKEYHASYKLHGRSRSPDCDACRGLGLKEQLKRRFVPRSLKKSKNSIVILGTLPVVLAVLAWCLGARGVKRWLGWAWSYVLCAPKLYFEKSVGLPYSLGMLVSDYWPPSLYGGLICALRFLLAVTVPYTLLSYFGYGSGTLNSLLLNLGAKVTGGSRGRFRSRATFGVTPQRLAIIFALTFGITAFYSQKSSFVKTGQRWVIWAPKIYFEESIGLPYSEDLGVGGYWPLSTWGIMACTVRFVLSVAVPYALLRWLGHSPRILDRISDSLCFRITGHSGARGRSGAGVAAFLSSKKAKPYLIAIPIVIFIAGGLVVAWYLGIGNHARHTAQSWALRIFYYPKLAFDVALGLPAYEGLLSSGAGGYYWPLTPYEHFTTSARFLALVAACYFATSQMGVIGDRSSSRRGAGANPLMQWVSKAFSEVGPAANAVSLFFIGRPGSPHRGGFWSVTMDGWVNWVLRGIAFIVLAFVGYNMYFGLQMFGWRTVVGVTSWRDVWTALKLAPRLLLAASLAVRMKMCEASCYNYANSGLLRWSNEVGCRYNCWSNT